MKIFNICDSLTTSVVKHVQLQKMCGCDTVTAFKRCGIFKHAAGRCGIMFQPSNIDTVNSFAAWCDVIVVHTSVAGLDLLDNETFGKPVIWACHDYVIGSEVEFAGKVSACLVPSYGYKAMIKHLSCPVAIIQRKVPSAEWPEWHEDRINCTILSGVVANDERAPYRDYSDAQSMLKGRLIIQSAKFPSQMADQYPVLELVSPSTMLERMAMFDTSWAGCGNNAIEFDKIVNNKMHEGIASGAVPILYRSREMSEYCDQFKCGITWAGSYPTQQQIEDCRKSILDNKQAHCLESEVPILSAILSVVTAPKKPDS